MPDDWLTAVERIIIRLAPAYTLELLDESDIWRILPFYFYDYRLKLRTKEKENTATEEQPENIVIRNGKKYRKVTAGKAKWSDNIF